MAYEKDTYIGIQIEPAVKRAFDKLCQERGSNMSVEIKRFIYAELKEARK